MNRVTAVESMTESLRQAILQGQFAPGQRLIEGELMGEYDVSRGPVRETLRRLAAEGLVDIEAFRGAIVRRLSRKRLRHSFKIRELLEGLAARCAAENYSAAFRNRDKAAILLSESTSWGKDSQDIDQYLVSNAVFHSTIITLSEIENLGQLISYTQTPALRFHFSTLLTPIVRAHSNKEHAEIVAAIVKGNPIRAEQAMRNHVKSTALLTEKLPDNLFPADRMLPG